MIAFFGSFRMRTSAGSSRSCEGGDDRQAADELGDQAVLQQILGLDHGQQVADPALLAALDLGAEAHARAADRGAR